MRVVHFNSVDCGGAGNSALRLIMSMDKYDIKSQLIVGYKTTKYNFVIQYSKNNFEKILSRIQRYLKKIYFKLRYVNRENVPFSFGLFGVNAKKIDCIYSADIIHLHWINDDFISLNDLAYLCKLNKIIIWTVHDSWAFTGGCHVRYGCDKFICECGECPMLHSKNAKDITWLTLKRKQRKLKNNNIIFIVPSKWMMNSITKSSLFKNNKCYHIPNAINENIYKEIGEERVEKILDYTKDKKLYHILFGASSTKIPFKGFSYLIEMLEIIDKNDSQLKENLIIHFIGEENDNNDILNRFHTKFWGYISDENEMAALYNLADIYVYPSIDDNLPNMVMESMACGTPVVAFNTGGIPEMVEHKYNGYIATQKDSSSLLDGIYWIINNNDNNILGDRCRKKVMNKYSQKVISELYYDIYKEVKEKKENV